MTQPADPLELLRRASGLSLDAEGQLLHEGEPIQHPGLRQLFQSSLDVLPSGEAIVRVGDQWAYVDSPGSPFVVQHLRATGDAVSLRLNTGATVTVPASELRLRLHGDWLLTASWSPAGPVARFGRRAWHALAMAVDQGGDGRLWATVGPHRLAVERSALGGP
ncbi:MAG: hypothetical protein HY902_20600 [Deltaproteobacteria bacterium]|nr:hypothetical protein [Deltaproteobacteria bacterium]